MQSRLIYQAIRRHAAEKEVPVLAFVEDVGASGGYILALAGDEIYADESSVVGSIGVIAGGFGFHEAIEKLGIERRVHTAGENKSILDPFKVEKSEDVRRLKEILNELHDQFIALVKDRRGDKLADEKELFSGAFWTGSKAKALGLIDGTAQFDDFLRARYGKNVKVKRISPESGSMLKKLLTGEAISGVVPSSAVDVEQFLEAAERRALWTRFGL